MIDQGVAPNKLLGMKYNMDDQKNNRGSPKEKILKNQGLPSIDVVSIQAYFYMQFFNCAFQLWFT
jgi:hypothetical protein